MSNTMTSKPPDDFDAVRLIVETLKHFSDPKDQERIIRWAREKLGLISSSDAPLTHVPATSAGTHSVPASGLELPRDIKSFIAAKDPQTDQQFAAVVAYYYRFEAPEPERKVDISADDIQEATRKAGRDRFSHPGQTLRNAHNQGYFDKAIRGRFSLNTVGENLVAMALPQSTAAPARRKAKRTRRARK